MRRERFEIKYCFPLEKLDQLIAFIQPFMKLDKYSDNRDKIGSYKVSSLYYDSPAFDFYRTHLEGYQSRRKVRVRRYSSLNQGDYFLEIKNKTLFSTNKYRIKFDRNLLKKAAQLRDFNQLFELFLKKHEGNWISEMVHFDVTTLKIKPVVFISYKRIAYNSQFEYDVRLTLDFNIQASRAKDFFRFKHQGQARDILSNQLGVLELKSDQTMPRWFRDIIVRFGLRRVAFSKYQESIKSIYNL